MRRSIATVSLSGALEQKLAAAAAAGFDGVELFENDLIACPLSAFEVGQYMRTLELEPLLYQPFRDFEAVPAELLARNLRRAERKFAVMDELGADLMLVCSSVSEQAISDDRLAALQLRELAEHAAERGMRVAYEALAWGRHVNRLEQAWRIVQLADHPNLGVCLDSFHILARGEDPRLIDEIPGEKIFFLQLADAPQLRMDVLQWSRHHRCLPGQGGFDLTEFVEHTLAAGYDGPLSLEVFNDVLRQTRAELTAVDAMRSLLALEDSVADRAPALAERISLTALPPAPTITGYEFVELAVDHVSEPVVEALLGAVGLKRTGQHRSKPVEMWGQGGIRVLLNRDGRSAPDHGIGAARISVLALECADPNLCAARAALLLAPQLPRERGPREAELNAIAAPDGTSVFLCRPQSGGAPAWVDDFISLNGHRAVESGLLGVDHVALSQPFECFDEALLFYRSVLGLSTQASHELSAPQGLVRSRALTSANHSMRVVLNVPLVGGGSSHPPDVEHVAFRCRNIFEAAEHVRADGVPILPITDNYYDDLAARFELTDELIKAMRQLGVLYDRDGQGEFFHFYTPPAGPRLFFEVVERRDGYDGYGAANSPVRMAAQRSWLEAACA